MQTKLPTPGLHGPETYMRGSDLMVEVRPHVFVRAETAERLGTVVSVKTGTSINGD